MDNRRTKPGPYDRKQGRSLNPKFDKKTSKPPNKKSGGKQSA